MSVPYDAVGLHLDPITIMNPVGSDKPLKDWHWSAEHF